MFGGVASPGSGGALTKEVLKDSEKDAVTFFCLTYM